MRRWLIALLVGVALAAAGGAWAYGHHRYGQMLNEWRWRSHTGHTRSAGLALPASPLL
jgi:hypothetical protein